MITHFKQTKKSIENRKLIQKLQDHYNGILVLSDESFWRIVEQIGYKNLIMIQLKKQGNVIDIQLVNLADAKEWEFDTDITYVFNEKTSLQSYINKQSIYLIRTVLMQYKKNFEEHVYMYDFESKVKAIQFFNKDKSIEAIVYRFNKDQGSFRENFFITNNSMYNKKRCPKQYYWY